MIYSINYFPELVNDVNFEKMVDKLSNSNILNKNIEDYNKLRYEFYIFSKSTTEDILKGVNLSIKDKFNNFKNFDNLFKTQIYLFENLTKMNNTYPINLQYSSSLTNKFTINSDKFTNILCDIVLTRYCYTFMMVSIIRNEFSYALKNVDINNVNQNNYLNNLKNYFAEPAIKLKKLYEANEEIWNYLNLMNIQILDLKKELLYFLHNNVKISYFNLDIFCQLCENYNTDFNKLPNILKVISNNLREINSFKNYINTQYDLVYKINLLSFADKNFIYFVENLNIIFAIIILFKITKTKKKNMELNNKDKTVLYGKLDKELLRILETSSNSDYLLDIINKFLNEKNKRSLSKYRKLLNSYNREIDTSIFYNKNFFELIEYFKK